MSDRFLVSGGNRLVGEVVVGGAKNSVLKLMAAALLAEGTSVITNCPDILDVPLMAEVLRGLGCDVELEGDEARITTPAQPKYQADFAAVRQFRASVCVLGPLVARCRKAVVALPGGDAIGSRPLDMHQTGLRLLGGAQHHRARLRGGRGRRPARQRDPAGLSVGRGHREHPDGRRPGERRDHDRQRGPRAGDRGPVQHARSDGGPHLRCRHLDTDDHGRSASRTHHPPCHRRSHRRGDMGGSRRR